MKILYVLSAFGKASGGHFHSLNNISRALDGYEDLEIEIVSIGNATSPILKTHPKFRGNLTFKWYRFFELNAKFKRVFQSYRPDVVHCYDGGTALLLMMLPVMRNIPIIHTRCGGANERLSVAQWLPTVILFSRENLASYQSNPRFANVELQLIPNRVREVLPANTEAEQKLLPKDPHTFTFLRTARIGRSYLNSILQGIELIGRLNTDKKVRFVIIGVLEDQVYAEQLHAKARERNVTIEIYSTREYTTEASRFLYVADAVIGTGRGAMEAMSAGIPTFAPVHDLDLPAPVNEHTLQPLADTNFSQRGSVKGLTEDAIVEEASRLVSDSDFYATRSAFARNAALENFIITETIKAKYRDIYHRAMQKPTGGRVGRNLFPILYYLNVYRQLDKRRPES